MLNMLNGIFLNVIQHYLYKKSTMKLLPLLFGFSLLAHISNAQQTAEPADKVLAAAYKQAVKENKQVIVMFHASWCGWCHKMDASMNDESCKKFFSDNYVIVHLTVEESAKNKNLENPGADVIKAKYHGEKAGLPFWLILDNKGTLIGDSYIRPKGTSLDVPGDNIGCPADENEVTAFIELLKRSSSLKDDQLAVIAARFKKNKS